MESWAMFQRRAIFDLATKKIVNTRPYAFSLELKPDFTYNNQKIPDMLDSAYGGLVLNKKQWSGFILPDSGTDMRILMPFR
jgi:hypothetical protein